MHSRASSMKKGDNLVKAGQIISTAQEFCQAIAATDTTMILLEVQPQTIEDCKTELEAWKVPRVPGLASAHAVVPGTFLSIRNTSCFKDGCYTKIKMGGFPFNMPWVGENQTGIEGTGGEG